jgi:hypothetical protein
MVKTKEEEDVDIDLDLDDHPPVLIEVKYHST